MSPWWVDTWALDMAMWYWSVAILFWQLSIDHIVNGQCKRCGFAKTRLRHPSLLFDSFPYPTRTICRRVRTYVRTYAGSVMWQPKEKRLTIFYEHGALSHVRLAREGAPLLIVLNLTKVEQGKLKSSLRIALWVKCKMAATMEGEWVLDLPD